MLDYGSQGPIGTLQERETLIKLTAAKKTGFTPRHVEKLVKQKLPRSMTNIECNHHLRSSTQEAAYGHPSLSYQLWLEAGKFPPAVPECPDQQHNSNIWRNFRQQYRLETNKEGQSVSEMIAAMYPLNIPSPSQVGKYTYGQFVMETPLIKNPKIKQQIFERTTKDVDEFKRLRLRSELRDPPIDKSGNIVPPTNFKKYEHHFVPPVDALEPPMPPLPPGPTRTDIMGQQVPVPKNQPYQWRLRYKLNHPQYERVAEALKKKQLVPKQPPSSFVTVVK